jgi:hypothetical protein
MKTAALEAVLRPRGPFERSLNFCPHLFHGHQIPHAHQRVRQDLVALDQAGQPRIQKAVDRRVSVRELNYVGGRLLCQVSILAALWEWGQGEAECYRSEVTRRIPFHKQQRRPPGVSAGAPPLSVDFLSLVGLSVFDSFIVQVVLGRAIIGTTDHRFHTHILQFRYQT